MSRWLQIKTGNSEISLRRGAALNRAPCISLSPRLKKDSVLWDVELVEIQQSGIWHFHFILHFLVFPEICSWTLPARPWRKLLRWSRRRDETASWLSLLWQIRCSLDQLPAIRSQGNAAVWAECRTEDMEERNTLLSGTLGICSVYFSVLWAKWLHLHHQKCAQRNKN